MADAEDLAYREITADSNHIGFNQIELEPNTVNCYLGKLSSIHNASQNSTGSLNEMLSTYEIHQGPRTILNGMSIIFVDSSSLKQEILTDPSNTSNSFFNELYSDYGFTSIFETWDNKIYIESQNNYNVRYIKELLSPDPQILYVSLNFFFLDGLGIEYSPGVDSDLFTFSYGWGDCPSGCMAKHFWVVQVDQDCNATLIEEYGNDLPE